MPSVTSIIRAANPVLFEIDGFYLERGTAVHKAIELHLANDLDERTIDHQIAPFLDSFKEFQKTLEFQGHHSEQFLYSKKYGYAGCADLIVNVGRDKWLIDVKTNSVPDTVGKQLAAYKQGLIECGIPITKRFSLCLKRDKFQFREHNESADFQRFLMALKQYKEINPILG